MAIDLGTIYTTLVTKSEGQEKAAKATDKTSKALIRQADALAKARLAIDKMKAELKGVKEAAPHVKKAEDALKQFERRAQAAKKSSIAFTAAQKDFKNKITKTRIGMTKAGVATNGWQDRMQELTKSVQLALGPLSGVAARITALSSLFNKATLIWAGFFASITGVVVAMHKAVGAGALYENSMAKIQRQLELTRHASGQTTGSIDDMTKALARNTLASVQGARDAATAILTFTSITGKNVERTLSLAQDLTDSLGGDLLGNAKKLGKAIEDPSEAFKTLNEMGARLAQSEKDRLKSMVAMGKHAEAQEFLFGKIEERIEGIGKAGGTGTLAGAMDTLGVNVTLFFEALSKNSGMIDNFKKTIENVSETVLRWTSSVERGVPALEAFGSAVGAVSNAGAFLIRNLDSVINALGGLAILKVATASVSLLRLSYSKLTTSIAANVAATKVATLATGTYTKVTIAQTVATRGVTAATSTFNKVMRATPWGMVASLAAMAAAAIWGYSDATDGAAESTKRLSMTMNEVADAAMARQVAATKLRLQETAATIVHLTAKLVELERMNGKGTAGWNRWTMQLSDAKVAMKRVSGELAAMLTLQKNTSSETKTSTKATLKQIDALNALTASYNPSVAALKKYNQDVAVMKAALTGTNGELMTLERFLAANTKKQKLNGKEVEELTAKYKMMAAVWKGTESVMSDADPFKKAKVTLENMIKEQRNAAASAGGSGAMIDLNFSTDNDRITKTINTAMGLINDGKDIAGLKIHLDSGVLVETKDQLAQFMRETDAEIKQTNKIAPFSAMLESARVKIDSVAKATSGDIFGRLFNTKAYQDAVKLEQSIDGIGKRLSSQNIKEGSAEFARMGKELQEMAGNRGLGDLVDDEAIKNLDGYSTALAKVLEASNKAPVSMAKIMGGVQTMMGQLETIMGGIVDRYGEMASASTEAAQRALENAKSQSEFYMELANSVHYSNNEQARSFEDKAKAAAEAGAMEYAAQKAAAAKANALAAAAFENQKKLQIAQVIMSTATAAMKAYEQFGVYGAIAAAGMAAVGAMQISAISSQQYTPREKGGSLTGGKPYLVGEKGPELMIPGAGGTMIPNNKLDDFAGGGGGASNITFEIHANDTKDFDKLLTSRRSIIQNMVAEANDRNMRNER